MKTPAEDYLYMIEHAIKAPSGHNTQPWLFRIHENKIMICPDNRKILPVVDNNRQEMFISLGCATENLCIAAAEKGYANQTEISDEGCITVHILPDSIPLPPSDSSSLFREIRKRQTNRSIYDAHLIPEQTIRHLFSKGQAENIHFHCWQRNTSEFKLLQEYVLQGNALQMRDPSFIQELKSWMRFNKKHEQQTKDGLSYAVFGAPNLPAWLSRIIMNACLNPGTQNASDRKKLQSASHIALFCIEKEGIENWIRLGRILERFLLEVTQAGLAVAFINQPCEMKDLSEQIQHELLKTENETIPNEIPTVMLRMGYAKPMPYSLRKDIQDVIIRD